MFNLNVGSHAEVLQSNWIVCVMVSKRYILISIHRLDLLSYAVRVAGLVGAHPSCQRLKAGCTLNKLAVCLRTHFQYSISKIHLSKLVISKLIQTDGHLIKNLNKANVITYD